MTTTSPFRLESIVHASSTDADGTTHMLVSQRLIRRVDPRADAPALTLESPPEYQMALVAALRTRLDILIIGEPSPETAAAIDALWAPALPTDDSRHGGTTVARPENDPGGHKGA